MNHAWMAVVGLLLAGCVQPVDEGSGAGGNRDPVIRSLEADPIGISTGGLTTITVVADDPDNQPLTYRWSATSGDFLGDGASVRYTASWCCVGVNQIRVTVRDNAGGNTSREISISVSRSTPMITRAAVIGVVLSILSVSASGQGCCTAGVSGQGGIDRGVLRMGLLSLTANYQSFAFDRTYQAREMIPDPQNRIAEASFLTIQVEYGLSPDLSVLASYSYSVKSRELTAVRRQGGSPESEVAAYRAAGWGDLLLLAKYDLLGPTLLAPFELALGGGAMLPTGSTSEEREGAILSQDLQPGLGTPSLLLWFFGAMEIRDPGISISLIASYRYAGTNLDGYRIGDELVTALGAEWAIDQHFALLLPLRGRFQRKDFTNRRVLSGTGGSYWDLVPALVYHEGNAAARVFCSLPVYRNVAGIQMTPGIGIGAEVSYTVDLR